MRHVLLATLLLGTAAVAAEPAPKPKGPKIDLGLPTFNAIPNASSLERPKERALAEPAAAEPSGTYGVVRVTHGKGFLRSPDGARPVLPYEAVSVSGVPPSTEKFSSVVRVKCEGRLNAPIEVAIVDARGDTVMEASGELFFRGQKQDELDYQVDWEPTALRRSGDLQVLVRVAGKPMGTWPLKVVEKK